MNKRNTFWPCIIPQKGEPKPCHIQSLTPGNGFSAVPITRYRGRGTRRQIVPVLRYERGVSHNETENARPADLTAGVRVLVECLVGFANR